ncbi:hypothetical protein C8R44DRAFT_868814 [Mycena epipterygia]|nr:hypothetical protein C8R44DRAFT_868814 [Mycena epipterygia]
MSDLPFVLDASSPFSGAAVAPDDYFEPPPDIILRSSDSVDFHCHKSILAHASPFFSDMFGAVSGNRDDDIQKDGKAVIVLVEPSAVLYGLLPRVYPAHSAKLFSLTEPDDLNDICAIHEAANKYQMVRTQALIEDLLLNSPLLKVHPHRFFAIGSVRSITALVRRAALCTLNDAIDPLIPFIPEFDLITGNRAIELVNFFQRCALRAQSLANTTTTVHEEMLDRWDDYLNSGVIVRHDANSQPFIWWREEGHAAQCGPTEERFGGVRTQDIVPPLWYRNHVRQLANSLRLLPNGRTARAEGVDVSAADRAAIAACPACAQHALHDLANLASQLETAVVVSNEKVADEIWT